MASSIYSTTRTDSVSDLSVCAQKYPGDLSPARRYLLRRQRCSSSTPSSLAWRYGCECEGEGMQETAETAETDTERPALIEGHRTKSSNESAPLLSQQEYQHPIRLLERLGGAQPASAATRPDHGNSREHIHAAKLLYSENPATVAPAHSQTLPTRDSFSKQSTSSPESQSLVASSHSKSSLFSALSKAEIFTALQQRWETSQRQNKQEIRSHLLLHHQIANHSQLKAGQLAAIVVRKREKWEQIQLDHAKAARYMYLRARSRAKATEPDTASEAYATAVARELVCDKNFAKVPLNFVQDFHAAVLHQTFELLRHERANLSAEEYVYRLQERNAILRTELSIYGKLFPEGGSD